MTTTEFSIEFDILYNNIMSNAAPGLNEYEKSVLLTQAQETIVLKLYNGTLNADSFETTEEVKSYLEYLVTQKVLTDTIQGEGISKKSKIYLKPENLLFIVYESAVIEGEDLGCKNGSDVEVQPIIHDSYHNIKNNPFRKDNENRVLRLMSKNNLELISDYNISKYKIRYIRKPNPIILEDLTSYGVTIDGKTEVTECELHPSLHRIILNTAVQLAKSIWIHSGNE